MPTPDAPPTLVKPPGVGANVWGDLAEFKAYLGTRANVPQAVIDADDPTTSSALLDSTRTLEALVEWDSYWVGDRVDSGQPLSFPVKSFWTRRRDKEVTDETGSPDWAKRACFEQTIALLEGDRTSESATTGLKSVKLGPISLGFDGEESNVSRILAQDVKNLLHPYAKSYFEDPSSDDLVAVPTARG